MGDCAHVELNLSGWGRGTAGSFAAARAWITHSPRIFAWLPPERSRRRPEIPCLSRKSLLQVDQYLVQQKFVSLQLLTRGRSHNLVQEQFVSLQLLTRSVTGRSHNFYWKANCHVGVTASSIWEEVILCLHNADVRLPKKGNSNNKVCQQFVNRTLRNNPKDLF